MRRCMVIFIMAVLLLLPLSVRAQGEVRFDSVLVQLWPEFDKPEMLVLMELNLAADVALPLDLEIRLPQDAMIHVVAVGLTQDTVTDKGIIHEARRVRGDLVVTIQDVSSPAVRIEYYDSLERQGERRYYSYLWPGAAATKSLVVMFQLPVDATGLMMDPVPIHSSSDTNGLNYYQVDFLAREAGATASLEVSYQKTTSRLSASLPSVQVAAPLDSGAQGRISFSIYLPWLIGVAGFLMIVIGMGIGLSYWRGTDSGSIPRRRHGADRVKNGIGRGMTHCPECGHCLQPGDMFCRACGSRISPEGDILIK